MKSAIVLCSGGLDSIVTAHYAKKALKYDNITLLFFDYGQKGISAERLALNKSAKDLKARIIELKLPELGKISTSLINKAGRARKIKRGDLKDTSKEGQKWYVPARNAIFLMYADAIAESIRIKEKRKCDIFVGFKNEGVENYPDTSIEFVTLINRLNKLSTQGKFRVLAPLISQDKEDVVLLGKKLGVRLGETFSCYTSRKIHCGYCLACRLRQEGFYWANVNDPTIYREKLKDFRLASNHSR